jgi:hypothetical protein
MKSEWVELSTRPEKRPVYLRVGAITAVVQHQEFGRGDIRCVVTCGGEEWYVMELIDEVMFKLR